MAVTGTRDVKPFQATHFITSHALPHMRSYKWSVTDVALKTATRSATPFESTHRVRSHGTGVMPTLFTATHDPYTDRLSAI